MSTAAPTSNQSVPISACTKATVSHVSMSHRAYEATPAGDAFVPSLATVLTHLVSLSPAEKGPVTRFHAVKAPDISIKDYLDRIQKYFGCSNECFVLSLVYIDRIVKIHDEFSVSILNIHRLLITSVMLAAKFFDDVYYSNAFYARVGGVKTKEINLLEWQFLSLIHYNLFVTPREYEQYLKNVLAAVNAGIQRPLQQQCLPGETKKMSPCSDSPAVRVLTKSASHENLTADENTISNENPPISNESSISNESRSSDGSGSINEDENNERLIVISSCPTPEQPQDKQIEFIKKRSNSDELYLAHTNVKFVSGRNPGYKTELGDQIQKNCPPINYHINGPAAQCAIYQKSPKL